MATPTILWFIVLTAPSVLPVHDNGHATSVTITVIDGGPIASIAGIRDYVP